VEFTFIIVVSVDEKWTRNVSSALIAASNNERDGKFSPEMMLVASSNFANNVISSSN
jgi:hypothetical protein